MLPPRKTRRWRIDIAAHQKEPGVLKSAGELFVQEEQIRIWTDRNDRRALINTGFEHLNRCCRRSRDGSNRFGPISLLEWKPQLIRVKSLRNIRSGSDRNLV